MGFEPMPSVEDQNSLSDILPIQEQGINLESGALDHLAILTLPGNWIETMNKLKRELSYQNAPGEVWTHNLRISCTIYWL